MNPFEQIAEEVIQKAMQEGFFNNLSGSGKPLRLDDNPFEPPEWRMANSILHNQGFVYPWMEIRKQMDAELEGLHYTIRKNWNSENTPDHKRTTLLTFSEQIKRHNRKILDYNLCVPSHVFQRSTLDLETEIMKALGNLTRSDISDLLDLL